MTAPVVTGSSRAVSAGVDCIGLSGILTSSVSSDAAGKSVISDARTSADARTGDDASKAPARVIAAALSTVKARVVVGSVGAALANIAGLGAPNIAIVRALAIAPTARENTPMRRMVLCGTTTALS